MVSEDSTPSLEAETWPFLLIVRTPQIVTFVVLKVLGDTRMFQHIARFY